VEPLRAVSRTAPPAERPRDERLLSGAPVPKRMRSCPARSPLAGDAVRLEPLDPAKHGGELFLAGHEGEAARSLWTYMPYGPFKDHRAFREWLEACAAFNDPLFFAVCDRANGKASGMASYLNIRPSDGVLEVGHIWFTPGLQRTRATTEALYLLIYRAFDELEYRRVEWKCDALNAPSRRAALRLGFRFEGIFYRHMIVKGRNRDTAWYSILAEEWPERRAAFGRWLARENFDGEGRQRLSLATLGGAA
jgi:RimJ/RimL family protein N-acetyltransferase